MSSKSTCWRHENSVSVPISSSQRPAISGDLKRENYISVAFLCVLAQQSIYQINFPQFAAVRYGANESNQLRVIADKKRDNMEDIDV